MQNCVESTVYIAYIAAGYWQNDMHGNNSVSACLNGIMNHSDTRGGGFDCDTFAVSSSRFYFGTKLNTIRNKFFNRVKYNSLLFKTKVVHAVINSSYIACNE